MTAKKIIPDGELPKKSTSIKWNKEEIEFYYKKALKILAKGDHTQSEEYVEILTEQCMAEKEFHEGLIFFLEYIKSEGLHIETDQHEMEERFKKLANLRCL